MSPRIELRDFERVGAWIAASLLAAVVIAGVPGVAAAADAIVQQASGSIERGTGEPPVWKPVARGDVLAPGDRLRTGSDGRAELVWQGSSIRLYGDSMLRLPTEGFGAAIGVELQDGTGLFDVEHRESGTFEVHTPDVVVSVKGTRFGVGLKDGPPEVWVYRGTVSVRGLALDNAREVLVREGFGSAGGIRGPADVFLLDHVDPWDHWADRIEPRSAAASPPASRATETAERSARRATRDRALALAVERNPKLARRLAAARSELRATLERERKREATDDSKDLAKAIDPVLDAETSDAERVLTSRFIEKVLDVPGDTLDVRLPGSGMIELSDSSLGQVWQLHEEDLEAVLEGSASLPTELENVLSTGDMDEKEVATLLLGLLRR